MTHHCEHAGTRNPRSPQRRRVTLVNLVLVVALAATGLWAYRRVDADNGASTSTVRTTAVRLTDVSWAVSATGTVTDPSEVGVNFASSGTLASVKAGAAAAPGADGTDLAKFQDCLKQHGVTSTQGIFGFRRDQQGGTPSAAPTSRPTMDAHDACRVLLPNGGGLGGSDQAPSGQLAPVPSASASAKA